MDMVENRIETIMKWLGFLELHHNNSDPYFQSGQRTFVFR